MSKKLLEAATQIMVMTIVIAVILLFIGIGVLVVIHVCIVGRAFRFRNSDAAVERERNGSRSMSKDDLEKLPCYDYIARDKESTPVDCAVCLDNFKMGDKCRLLPVCKHSFHAKCVDSWLLRNPICPICRTLAASHMARSTVSEDENEWRESQGTETSNSRIEVRDTQMIEVSNESGGSETEPAV